jgi:hypothetical protein
MRASRGAGSAKTGKLGAKASKGMKTRGLIFAYYLVLTGAARFLVEVIRINPPWVLGMSNAQVAKILGTKVIIVTQGGIGKPIDEVAINQALFEREGVEIIGVIINKVLGTKVDYITDFARRGFKRKGLDLLRRADHTERRRTRPSRRMERTRSDDTQHKGGHFPVAHS